jgi:hypothetical protein
MFNGGNWCSDQFCEYCDERKMFSKKQKKKGKFQDQPVTVPRLRLDVYN